MELQQMRYVIAVAEESNFTRAAARCFVGQPALSHQIKALERELGVAIFARTSRRVELTPAGRAFVPFARASVDAADRAISEARSVDGELSGELRFGVISTVTAIDVAAVIGRFRSAHPLVRLLVQHGGSDDLEDAIARGRTDVALLGLAEHRAPKGVAWQHLVSDRLVAVVHRDHPLAGAASLRLADLADEVFADFPRGTPGREQSDLAFEAAGVRREVAFEIMASGLMVDLLLRGLAIALLPSRFAPRDASLVQLELVDGPKRDEYLAWSSFNPSPAASALRDAIAASGVRG